MSKAVKVGVLGCYRGFHVVREGFKVLGKEGVTVRALCDLDNERVKEAEKWFVENGCTDILLFNDYKEMLKSDIEAIFIATDAPLHVEHAIMALEAGKHVLCEIPTIYSKEEAVMLKEAVNRHPELKFMVAENCCYAAFIDTWKKMYEDGKLGIPVYAESEYLHCETTEKEVEPPKDPKYWRNNLPGSRYLTHNLGPILYVLDDEVETVSCMVPDQDSKTLSGYYTEKKVAVILCKTKKGAVIRILICFGAYVGFDHNFAIYGTHGMLETDKSTDFDHKRCFARFSDLPFSKDKKIVVPLGFNPTENDVGHNGMDGVMFKDFIDCVANDKKPKLDVDYGIRISMPGISAEESYKNGFIPVNVPKF